MRTKKEINKALGEIIKSAKLLDENIMKKILKNVLNNFIFILIGSIIISVTMLFVPLDFTWFVFTREHIMLCMGMLYGAAYFKTFYCKK